MRKGKNSKYSGKKSQVVCDYCKKSFFFTKIMKRKMGDAVEKWFIKCPYCRHEFRICYENAELRKLRKEIRAITIAEASNEDLDHETIEKNNARVEEISEKIKCLNQSLIDKYEHAL